MDVRSRFLPVGVPGWRSQPRLRLAHSLPYFSVRRRGRFSEPAPWSTAPAGPPSATLRVWQGWTAATTLSCRAWSMVAAAARTLVARGLRVLGLETLSSSTAIASMFESNRQVDDYAEADRREPADRGGVSNMVCCRHTRLVGEGTTAVDGSGTWSRRSSEVGQSH